MNKLELAKTCGCCKHGDFTNRTSRHWSKPRHKEGVCLLATAPRIHQQNVCDVWEAGPKQLCSTAKHFVNEQVAAEKK